MVGGVGKALAALGTLPSLHAPDGPRVSRANARVLGRAGAGADVLHGYQLAGSHWLGGAAAAGAPCCSAARTVELLHEEYLDGAELIMHIGDISYANGREEVGAGCWPVGGGGPP